MKQTIRRGLAATIILPGIILVAASIVRMGQGDYVGYLLGAGGIALGTCLLQVGRKLWAPLADEMLGDGPRAPILLLRSFSDDELQLGQGGNITLSWTRAANETFEERIAGILQAYGPVIAIGRPGEKVRPLGAARMYVSHQEWQQRVAELLNRCQVVAMIVGQIKGEDGLAWEVRRLLEVQPSDKVLLIFPPLAKSESEVDKALDVRWQQYVRLGGGRIQPYAPGAVLAQFGKDGNCHLVCSLGSRDDKVYRSELDRFMARRGHQASTQAEKVCDPCLGECSLICGCGNEIGLMLYQSGGEVECWKCCTKISIPEVLSRGMRYDAKLIHGTRGTRHDAKAIRVKIPELTRAILWHCRIVFLTICIIVAGVSAIQRLPEYWALRKLRTHGRVTQAEVAWSGFHDEVGVKERRVLSRLYSFRYKVMDRAYSGSVLESDSSFREGFQRQEQRVGSSVVGTVPVTYLPSAPDFHRVGIVDDERASRPLRGLWFPAVVVIFFGGLFLATWLTKPDEPSHDKKQAQPPTDISQLPRFPGS
jgi:hypothetical protein